MSLPRCEVQFSEGGPKAPWNMVNMCFPACTRSTESSFLTSYYHNLVPSLKSIPVCVGFIPLLEITLNFNVPWISFQEKFLLPRRSLVQSLIRSVPLHVVRSSRTSPKTLLPPLEIHATFVFKVCLQWATFLLIVDILYGSSAVLPSNLHSLGWRPSTCLSDSFPSDPSAGSNIRLYPLPYPKFTFEFQQIILSSLIFIGCFRAK